MTSNDARALTAALALLTRAVGDSGAGQMQNAQRDPDADRKLPPEVVARMGADAAMERQYRERRFGYDGGGALQDRGRRAPQGGDVNGAQAGPGVSARVGQAVGEKIGTAANMIGAKFAALLGPMALLSQIITSNASGFQVLGSAVKLFAATLAPLLLPVFVVLAAAIVDLSDRMWNDIAPALEGFYELVVGTLLPAVEGIVDAFEAAAAFFQRQIDALTPDERTTEEEQDLVRQMRDAGMSDEAIEKFGFGDTIAAMAAKERNGGRPIDPRNPTGAGDYEGGIAGAGGGGDYGPDDGRELTAEEKAENARIRASRGDWMKGEGGGSRTGKAMGEVLQELRASLGPKAQFTSVSQLSRGAQLAAINQSPFETKMIDRVEKMLGAMERVAAGVGRPTVGP